MLSSPKPNPRALTGVRGVFIFLSVMYFFGAILHIARILSLTSFDWKSASFGDRLVDWIGLGLDAMISYGLATRRQYAVLLLLGNAIGQLILLTGFREWVLTDLSGQAGPRAVLVLNCIVAFHSLTIAFVVAAALQVGIKERQQ